MMNAHSAELSAVKVATEITEPNHGVTVFWPVGDTLSKFLAKN
jgi:hypothetical protein